MSKKDLIAPMANVSIEEFRKMFPNIEDISQENPVELCTCGRPSSRESLICIENGVDVRKACKCKAKE